jgi:hypothetical protein
LNAKRCLFVFIFPLVLYVSLLILKSGAWICNVGVVTPCLTLQHGARMIGPEVITVYTTLSVLLRRRI